MGGLAIQPNELAFFNEENIGEPKKKSPNK
jgi:hypothetical protein